MRVSEHYGLDKKQPELDFVDVDITADTRLFVDPRGIRILESEWGHRCVSSIQSFFQAVLDSIRQDDHDRAQELLSSLQEPNETRLGLSRGRAQGHGMGPELAARAWNALRGSEAVQTGLLQDLEDTVLLVEGIDRDIISDIATNLIRELLIEYTQTMAAQEGIPLESVDSGPMWDSRRGEWLPPRLVDLPVAGRGKLLLVPKIIVRRTMEYEHAEYFRDYILPCLAEVEKAAGTELVHLLKNKTTRVTKKDLIGKYGKGKAVAAEQTLAHPEVLSEYRRDKGVERLHPMQHEEIAAAADGVFPDWKELLAAVERLIPGKEAADQYHRAVEKLLTAVFYPSLSMPIIEYPIHDGRKRIDIRYLNTDKTRFFWWLGQHYPAAYIFVECKNYAGDPANPELDQLAGRFSPSRGKFGMLVCRQLTNRGLFIQRCRDTARDDRGFIVALDDSDLRALIDFRMNGDIDATTAYLQSRFDDLVM